MAKNQVQLLHVEDHRIQRTLVAQLLHAVDDYEFQITSAETEDEAITTFQRGRFDLVLLDYSLPAGNGLSCLRRLRELDPLVPIIAVSGIATPEIAAELIDVGADDYLDKRKLNETILGESVRNALDRSRAVRRQARPVAHPNG